MDEAAGLSARGALWGLQAQDKLVALEGLMGEDLGLLKKQAVAVWSIHGLAHGSKWAAA